MQSTANMLHESWLIKQSLANGVTNAHVNDVYRRAREAGASGGKVLGTGGGGHMLLFAEPEAHAGILAATGLEQLVVKPSYGGVEIVEQGGIA